MISVITSSIVAVGKSAVAAWRYLFALCRYLGWRFGSQMTVSRNTKYAPTRWIDHFVWTTATGGRTEDVPRPGLFLRIRILNPIRRQPPRDVSVSVLSAGERRDAAIGYVRIRQAAFPKRLVWSSTERPGQPGRVVLPVLAATQDLVDLAVIHQPPGRYRDRGIVAGLRYAEPVRDPELVLVTDPEPTDDSHCFPPGDYRFGVELAASNRPPVHFTADVTLFGNWDGEREEGMVLYDVRDGEPEYST